MNVPRLLADRYLILDSLGADADGERFRARDARLDRIVEVLVLKEGAGTAEGAARLAAARRAAVLLHPHIVRIYDVAEDGGLAYIVQEAVEGGTLAQSLTRGHPYRPEVPAAVARQVALGLAAAHRQGIIHGSLTPERVRLSSEGHACVEGFGLTPADPTAPWTAPEVAAGGPPSPAADVYALGAMLYALLSGQPPRAGAPLALPPGIPDSLRDLTTRLLAPDPQARLDAAWTANALQGALEDAGRTTGVVTAAAAPQAGPPPAPRPTPPAPRPTPPAPSTAAPRPAAPLLPTAQPEPQGGSRRWWLIGLVVVGLLLAALAASQILRGPTAPPPAATATPFIAVAVTATPGTFRLAGRVDAIDGAKWTVDGKPIQVPFVVSNNPKPGVKATIDGVIRPDGQWVATRLTWEP